METKHGIAPIRLYGSIIVLSTEGTNLHIITMFLFNKKTRNIIKYMWSIMAILIVFSMIFAYSGFSSLSSTTTAQQTIDIPPEVQAQLELQRNGITTDGKVSTPEEQAVLDAINEGRLDINSEQAPQTNEDGIAVPAEDNSDAPTTPPAQELKLEI